MVFRTCRKLLSIVVELGVEAGLAVDLLIEFKSGIGIQALTEFEVFDLDFMLDFETTLDIQGDPN